MKNIIKSISILFTTLFLLASCYTPSPLYGTWTDNDGNKIQFRDNGTFSASILDSSDKLITYEGDWATIDNVLIFNIKGEEASYNRNTEWDIRGAMLSLTWTANNGTRVLTLYHTAR